MSARTSTPGSTPGAPAGASSGAGAAPRAANPVPGNVPLSTVAADLPPAPDGGMGESAAKWLERAIISTCVVAILMIFQPFSLPLFGWGCGLVVFGALAFNLVPFCRPDVSWRQVGRVAMIVAIVLAVAAALGIGTAWLYVRNLGALS